jgi:hypothetical protein
MGFITTSITEQIFYSSISGKRWNIASHSKNIKLDFMAKAGFGPVIPHVENVFLVRKMSLIFSLADGSGN